MTEDLSRAGYLRVADDLRDRIVAGEYAVGDAIPSTAELMSLYRVSSTVVRAAVRELRIEGIVQGQAGKAVFVTKRPDPREDPDDQVMAELQALRGDLASMNARLARVEAAVLRDDEPRAPQRSGKRDR